MSAEKMERFRGLVRNRVAEVDDNVGRRIGIEAQRQPSEFQSEFIASPCSTPRNESDSGGGISKRIKGRPSVRLLTPTAELLGETRTRIERMPREPRAEEEGASIPQDKLGHFGTEA